MTSGEKTQRLEAENAALKQLVKSLEGKVLFLLQTIEKQSIKKDSHNSHNPPASDKSKPKRTKSLRKKSTRKPGGQPGHKGHTLEMKPEPDEYHELKSDYCQNCGHQISHLPYELLSRRQVVKLPPIEPIYVEYRQYGCLCPCGHHQKGSYPQGVNAPIQYGCSIMALVSYFNVFQYIPYARCGQLFKDIFNLPISQGSIENLLNRAAKKSGPVYQAIFENIKAASYVGADETGAKVNGEKWWVWVWQNIRNTFLKASKSRGSDTVEQTFPEGLANATIGSDRWAAQLKTRSKDKQICFPHLQRELNFLEEKEKNDWAIHFKGLLKGASDLRQTAVDRNRACQKTDKGIYRLEQRLNRLLARSIVKEHFPETFKFQKSMIKYRNHLFPCLYDLEVPPDNNASERAVRNVKVKQKISGQFRSGQDTFCTLRSIIDTLRKRELDVLFFLKQIMAV